MSEKELAELAEMEALESIAAPENEPWQPWHTMPGFMTYQNLINGQWLKLWRKNNQAKLDQITVTEF